jgi:hypothetical protein
MAIPPAGARRIRSNDCIAAATLLGLRRRQLVMAFACASLLLGGAAPIRAVTLSTIATSGYDADIVFESGLASGAVGANNEIGSRQFYEKGATSPTDNGLPRTLPSFTTMSGDSINYAFQPFEQNNILKFTNGTAAKSISFAMPAPYSRLAVIHSGGSLGTNIEYGLLSYKINYVGGATQTGVVNTPDWGGVTTLPPGTERIYSADRTTANATTWPAAAEGSATPTRWALYVSEITPTSPAAAIQSVTFGPNSLYTIASMTTGPLNPSDDLVVFGLAGAVTSEQTLRLKVNKLSGVMQITNLTATAIDFNSYEITSVGNSLNLAGWSSLSDRSVNAVDGPDADLFVGNGAGETWDEAGGASNSALMEGFLLGASSLAPGASLPLGTSYNKLVGAEDLVFKVRGSNGVISTANVSYVNSLPADFDGDNDVDGTDLSTLRSNFGSTVATSAMGDADGDADVDGNDFFIWQQYKGAPPPVSAAEKPIPEPVNFMSIVIAGAAVGAAGRRRR